MASLLAKFLIFLSFSALFFLTTTTSALKSSSLNTTSTHDFSSLCNSTPYPESCYDSLKLSISINTTNPINNILNFLLQTLQTALSESEKLSILLSSSTNLVEKQKGIIQDCKELHQITISSLRKSVSRLSNSGTTNSRKLDDARTFLSAALTNKATCLEGLDFATGNLKPEIINSLSSTYEHVSNSLSILSNYSVKNNKGRRLLSKRITNFEDDYDESNVITVAADGTGNFTTITEAIDFVPDNSMQRTFIYIKEGVYQENVYIPSWKPNVVLLGDGTDVTVITGNRSVADGWTTFRSATVAVSGDGFLARGITFENTAGPEKHQAVALRINADLAAIYKCTIWGYQDTLYVHSFRQFYRECDIYGTIDYIFGNAAAVFQGCNIVSMMPMPNQFTVITAQSRESPEQNTGISIQNCSILATEDLYANSSNIKSYLGRPWRSFSRTVYLESYLDDFIEPEGWTEWSGNRSLDTLYYGEYANSGPASTTDNRVTWLGYHIMDYSDASNFTVSEFITGEEWLDSTSFPYDNEV